MMTADDIDNGELEPTKQNAKKKTTTTSKNTLTHPPTQLTLHDTNQNHPTSHHRDTDERELKRERERARESRDDTPSFVTSFLKV